MFIITKKVYGVQVYLSELQLAKAGLVDDWTPKRRDAIQFEKEIIAANLFRFLNDDDASIIPYKIPSPAKAIVE